MKRKSIALFVSFALIASLAACGAKESVNSESANQGTTNTQDTIVKPTADNTENNSSEGTGLPASTNFCFERCLDEYQDDCLIIHVSKDIVESMISGSSSSNQLILAGNYMPVYDLSIFEGVTSDYYNGEGAPNPDNNPDCKVWCSLGYFDESDYNNAVVKLNSGNTSTSIKDGYYSFFVRVSNARCAIDTNRAFGDLIVQEDSGEKSIKVTEAANIPEGFVYYYEQVDGMSGNAGTSSGANVNIPDSDFYVLANKDADSFASHSGHVVYISEDLASFDKLRVNMDYYYLIFNLQDRSCVLKEDKWEDAFEYTIPADQITIDGNKIDIFVDLTGVEEDFNLFKPSSYSVVLFKNESILSESFYQASTSNPDNSVMVIVE